MLGLADRMQLAIGFLGRLRSVPSDDARKPGHRECVCQRHKRAAVVETVRVDGFAIPHGLACGRRSVTKAGDPPGLKSPAAAGVPS